MSQTLRLTLRLGIAIVLTLCILEMNDASDTVLGGREFSRCTRACSAIRMACHDHCQADCAIVDAALQDACLLACDEVCVAYTQDCRSLCLQFKQNGPPVDP